jgi:hypothetical protein
MSLPGKYQQCALFVTRGDTSRVIPPDKAPNGAARAVPAAPSSRPEREPQANLGHQLACVQRDRQTFCIERDALRGDDVEAVTTSR